MHPATAILGCIWLLALSACSQEQIAAQQRAALIGELQSASEIDSQVAAAPTTDTAQAIDSLRQRQRALAVVGALQRGEEVSQPQILEALAVPPDSLPANARYELIRELNTAAQHDEIGEQTHGPGNDWLAWDSFRQQRHRARETARALAAGADVPWSEIQAALRVPDLF